ncbi:MAG: hypothetical protein RIB57_13565 [Pelagibacterium sp.]|uniref:hypothetical protein n=1 Tax=Pelagibacterium sp. TaxID=1967288 RepID=UPI0032EB60A8
MAEDIRDMDTKGVGGRSLTIAEEALRQSESALFTSTALYIWLRDARNWNRLFVIGPVVLGAVTGIIYAIDPSQILWAALLAVLTGLIPALRDALRLDIHLDQIKSLATEYKGLQDAFRQLAYITAPHDSDSAEKQLHFLMDQLNRARAHGITIPERVFRKAQEKVARGDYDFQVDTHRKVKPRV